MIQHFCSECGNEVSEFCASHPNAAVDSVKVDDFGGKKFAVIQHDPSIDFVTVGIGDNPNLARRDAEEFISENQDVRTEIVEITAEQAEEARGNPYVDPRSL